MLASDVEQLLNGIDFCDSRQSKKILFKETGNGCVECVSHADNGQGYIRVRRLGRDIHLHRLVLEITSGVSRNDMFVIHSCDNPPCCNPEHLRYGTHRENCDDKVARGRAPRGKKNWCTKLDEKTVLELHKSHAPVMEDARRYGVSKSAIKGIRSGKNWAWLTGGNRNANQ